MDERVSSEASSHNIHTKSGKWMCLTVDPMNEYDDVMVILGVFMLYARIIYS